MREAERYGVLPLDDISQRSSVGWWPEPKDRWVLYQDAVLPHHFKGGPRVRGVSHRITARIERQSTDRDGGDHRRRRPIRRLERIHPRQSAALHHQQLRGAVPHILPHRHPAGRRDGSGGCRAHR